MANFLRRAIHLFGGALLSPIMAACSPHRLVIVFMAALAAKYQENHIVEKKMARRIAMKT